MVPVSDVSTVSAPKPARICWVFWRVSPLVLVTSVSTTKLKTGFPSRATRGSANAENSTANAPFSSVRVLPLAISISFVIAPIRPILPKSPHHGRAYACLTTRYETRALLTATPEKEVAFPLAFTVSLSLNDVCWALKITSKVGRLYSSTLIVAAPSNSQRIDIAPVSRPVGAINVPVKDPNSLEATRRSVIFSLFTSNRPTFMVWLATTRKSLFFPSNKMPLK